MIQSSISLTIFYICYELLFKRDVYFQFVRYYFLFAILVSVFLPLMNVNLSQTIAENYNFPIYISPVPDLVAYTLGEVTIYGNYVDEANLAWYEQISGFGFIIITYLIGVLVSTLIFLARIVQLSRLLLKYRNSISKKLRIINIPDIPAFSFLNYIFIDGDKVNNDDTEKIIAHEKVHIEQKHSIDLILAEIFVIIHWFNPLAHILKSKIKENHEFIADRNVVGMYSDSIEYSRILIENSSIINTNILTHNFSYSLLKRRLFMIKRTKNPQLFSLKLIGVLIAVSLVVFACSDPVKDTDVNLDQTTEKTMEQSIEDQIYNDVESMPEYPGGMDKLIEYLSENIKYPAIAKDNDVEGKVFVSFVVQKDGTLSDVKIKKGIGSGCDDEAVRVISQMPDWTPGYKDGKAVNVSYTLPIVFKLDTKDKGDVFTVVEEMPVFPGGSKKLLKYIADNIKYPEKAKKDKVQGRVFITFVVEKDGSVSDVKLLRGIGSGCDEESMRVVRNMPNWTPGKQRGKPVRVQYNLPIKFQLD